MTFKFLFLIAFVFGILFSSCKSNNKSIQTDSLVGTYTCQRDSSALFRIAKDGEKYKVAFYKNFLSNKNPNKVDDALGSEPLEPASEALIKRFFGQNADRFVYEGWINSNLKFGLFKIKKGVVFKLEASEGRSYTGLFVVWGALLDYNKNAYVRGDAIRIRNGKVSPDENASKLIFSDGLSKIQDSLKLMKVLLNKLNASKYPRVEFSDTLSIDNASCFPLLPKLSELDRKYELDIFKKFSDYERSHFFHIATYLKKNFIDVAKKDSAMQTWQFEYKTEYGAVCMDRFILIESGNIIKSLPQDCQIIDAYQNMYLVKYRQGASCHNGVF